MYGFEPIAALAATTEQAVKTGSGASLESDLALLTTYLDHVQIVFAYRRRSPFRNKRSEQASSATGPTLN